MVLDQDRESSVCVGGGGRGIEVKLVVGPKTKSEEAPQERVRSHMSHPADLSPLFVSVCNLFELFMLPHQRRPAESRCLWSDCAEPELRV